MINFFKTKILPGRPTQLLIKTFLKWQKDQCLEMGAALSYYALFSLFPIFLVIASILGFLLGPDTQIFSKILALTQDSLPPEALGLVRGTLLQLNNQSITAGVIGFSLMFLTASNVFGALDRSVDKIWKADEHQAKSPTPTLVSTALSLISKKLVAFTLMISSSALLLLSLSSNIAIGITVKLIDKMDQSLEMVEFNQWLVVRVLQFSSSFFLLALTVLLLMRFLPSTVTPWQDLWPSALLTTILLLGLQQLVSHNVVHIGAQYQSYGVIGSVMILMLWLYFNCQIFLFGCELAYIYAHLFGSRRHHELEL
jgi:membrane protein